MTSFKFPPPPPPPPRASANDAQESYSSQRGGANNSRGDRGRGRGWVGRGRGNDFGGNSRGGRGRGDGGSNGGGFPPRGRGGYQQQNFAPEQPQQRQQQYPMQSTSQPLNVPAIPPGAYVNPLFVNQTPFAAPQVNPLAFAQAMAFMSTQVGMQSMATFANNMTGGVNTPQYPQPPPQPFHHQSHQSPPPQGNKKRKRNERASEWKARQSPQPTQNSQQSKQKPQKAKAAPPPAIPSFGFALPVAQSPATTKVEKRGGQKKRKVHLGLTHHEEEDSEDSGSNEVDEEVDEEAALASKIKLKGMVFEHDGQNISLQTPGEIAAWIKDRRKQYPTKKRIVEKEQELAAKRASELNFLRRVKEQTGKSRPVVQQISATVENVTAEKQNASVGRQRAELEQLRKKLHESIPKNKKVSSEPGKPQAIDLGLGYGSETESDEDDSSTLEESSVVSSSEESSEESESDSDSDAPPEEQSSKIAVPPIVVPPPPPTLSETAQKKDEPRYCFQWKQNGKCKFGNHCRWLHPSKEEKKPMGLYEKLVEQEKEQADRLALDAIKYLGRHGFLG